jgi:ADP-ribosylation factor GTPase-activating protein 1
MSSEAFQMKREDIEYLRVLPGNKECVDCGTKSAEWASVSLGTFFCLECSGKHRGLGTHISFVRSVTMDAWTEAQIKRMKKGGNQQCKDFLIKHGIDMTSSVREKYSSPAAQLYQDVLKAKVEGKPEPTEPPKQTATTAKNAPMKAMQGFGSTPLPSKKDVARERKAAILAASVSVAAAAAAVAWGALKR